MSAHDLMRQRAAPLRLVIFDCDGVLVDSEAISNGVLARDLSGRGWRLSTGEAEALFVGTALSAIEARAERHLGRALPADWRGHITRQIIEALAAHSVPIPGAREALEGVSRLGLPWRVASNSSHAEMAAKFGRLGWADLVAGRLHSFEDVARGKPAPDVFLAAAAAEGVAAAECLVVEDSVAGVTAARAAGMDCLGLDRHGDGAGLRAAGALPIRDIASVPGLVALALEHVA